MANNYQVNKGTLLEKGTHKWSVRLDNVVASCDIGVVSPAHTSHFNRSTQTAWGLRENGYCHWGQQQVNTRTKNGDILTFYLDLEAKTLDMECNNVKVFQWNDIIAPVHIAFSGGAGASATILP